MLGVETARHSFELIKTSRQVALRRELFTKAVDYSSIRARWLLSSIEQRKEMDQRRTAAHNTFIDACNIMSRNMGNNGEDNSWREDLGDDRKKIGDFACYIHCFLGLEAR